MIIFLFFYYSTIEKEQMKLDNDNNNKEMNERIDELTNQNKGLLEYILLLIYIVVIFIIKMKQ